MEVELKFQIPAERLSAVRKAATTASAQTTRLQARYLDTADRRLAGAAMALRLRLEGTHWVQTLKGRGDGQMQRLEHECRLDPSEAPADRIPALDVSRHAGDPAGQALLSVLGQPPEPLLPMFDTDVQRTQRVIRHGAARIELALDLGHIHCGERSTPLRELELELKAGEIADLIAVARAWVERHGLWLDVCTKAERGERLRDGRVWGRPQAELAVRPRGDDPVSALKAMVAAGLAQVLPNASDLASELVTASGAVATPASADDGAEHLHQLRVGLRRLCSALRLLRDLGPEQDRARRLAWWRQCRALRRQLGEDRDRDVRQALINAAWSHAGLATLTPPPMAAAQAAAAAPSPRGVAALLRAPETTRLWLDLLEWLHAPVEAGAERDATGTATSARLSAELARWQRQVRRGARRLTREEDDVALQGEPGHRLRKQIKRLRDGLSLGQAWLPARPKRRALRALAQAQACLGQLHDARLAIDQLSQTLPERPQDWLALGWLHGQLGAWGQQARDALRALRTLKLIET